MLALAATLVLASFTAGRAQAEDFLPGPGAAKPRPAFIMPRLQTQPPQGMPRGVSSPFGGTWSLSNNDAPVGGLNNPLLLTDGSVILHQIVTPNWYKLTPDIFGSYVNGTWSQIASMPSNYQPNSFASAVLPDGRVIVEGGEYNGGNEQVWTSLGAIYDPVANAWTAVAPPSGAGWENTDPPGSCNGGIGDAPSAVLANGTFLLAAACGHPPVDALFNAATLGWTATGAPTFPPGESGFTPMQTGKFLTIFALNPPNVAAYDPAAGGWSAVADTPVSLGDSCGSHEMGPATSRPDGTVVAFGGSSCTTSPDPTAVYNPFDNTWVQGPNVPSVCGSNGTTPCSLADASAVLLPNGNVLFAASPGVNRGTNVVGTHFFEFTTSNTINQVSDDPFASNENASRDAFLMLPNGQAMTIPYTNVVEFYTATGSANPAWAPTISTAPSCVAPGNAYILNGVQLNGLSQGAAFGDELQSATSYPLVRIVNNATQHVFYARTFGHSTMSIAQGQPGSTNFQVAPATETGPSMLYAVANGIASAGRPITVGHLCAGTHDFNGDGFSDVLWRDTGGDVGMWLMNGATISQAAGVANVPTVWSAVGQRDFNGDGKADILWTDTSGDVGMWLMNGTQITQAAGVANVPTVWSVAGTGDFNGDGKGDILWHDTSGNVGIWLMNGTQIVQAAAVGNAPPSVWSIAGTGDFNGDGKTDILWIDSSGDVGIWFMNGTQIASASGIGKAPPGWSIVGTGDFNGDGTSDILWRDTSGDIGIWFMSGGQIWQAVGIGNVPNVWSVAETGDFNGDGKSDILWIDTSGDVGVWLMNGSQISSASGIANVPTVWSIQGAGAD